MIDHRSGDGVIIAVTELQSSAATITATVEDAARPPSSSSSGSPSPPSSSLYGSSDSVSVREARTRLIHRQRIIEIIGGFFVSVVPILAESLTLTPNLTGFVGSSNIWYLTSPTLNENLPPIIVFLDNSQAIHYSDQERYSFIYSGEVGECRPISDYSSAQQQSSSGVVYLDSDSPITPSAFFCYCLCVCLILRWSLLIFKYVALVVQPYDLKTGMVRMGKLRSCLAFNFSYVCLAVLSLCLVTVSVGEDCIDWWALGGDAAILINKLQPNLWILNSAGFGLIGLSLILFKLRLQKPKNKKHKTWHRLRWKKTRLRLKDPVVVLAVLFFTGTAFAEASAGLLMAITKPWAIVFWCTIIIQIIDYKCRGSVRLTKLLPSIQTPSSTNRRSPPLAQLDQSDILLFRQFETYFLQHIQHFEEWSYIDDSSAAGLLPASSPSIYVDASSVHHSLIISTGSAIGTTGSSSFNNHRQRLRKYAELSRTINKKIANRVSPYYMRTRNNSRTTISTSPNQLVASQDDDVDASENITVNNSTTGTTVVRNASVSERSVTTATFDQNEICGVCLDNCADIILHPCRHRMLCEKCIRQLLQHLKVKAENELIKWKLHRNKERQQEIMLKLVRSTHMYCPFCRRRVDHICQITDASFDKPNNNACCQIIMWKSKPFTFQTSPNETEA